MVELTANEVAWIKGASEALIAIRFATRDELDDEQRHDIRFLADAFHNIGMVDGQRPMFAHMHTPDTLARASTVTERLRESVHRRRSPKRSILSRVFGRPGR
jgi:hypothetical protein